MNFRRAQSVAGGVEGEVGLCLECGLRACGSKILMKRQNMENLKSDFMRI
jgi:hypothetical protein